MASRPETRLLILLLTSMLALSACSRSEIYESAIDYERSSAGLEAHRLQTGELDIAYLSNAPIPGAETLILVHGFAANKDNWLRMSSYLTDTYNVYAIDLPGHGESTQSPELDYSIANQVEYLHGILATLDLDQVHLVGNSMGGAISTLYSATYPEQVRSLALLNPAGVNKYESRLGELVRQGKNPLIVEEAGGFERLIDFALEQKPFVPWPIYSVMEDRAMARKSINEKIFKDITSTSGEHEINNVLSGIQTPTLVVWGREDRVINHRNAEVYMAALSHAENVLMDNVGHMPMIEVPEESATLVRNLVEQTTPATATVQAAATAR